MNHPEEQFLAQSRQEHGFLTPMELRALAEECGNTVFDFSSVLISRGVRMGMRNIVYPNVILKTEGDGLIDIGDGNTFFPGTIIRSTGKVRIGNGNEIGEGEIVMRSE